MSGANLRVEKPNIHAVIGKGLPNVGGAQRGLCIYQVPGAGSALNLLEEALGDLGVG